MERIEDWNKRDFIDIGGQKWIWVVDFRLHDDLRDGGHARPSPREAFENEFQPFTIQVLCDRHLPDARCNNCCNCQESSKKNCRCKCGGEFELQARADEIKGRGTMFWNMEKHSECLPLRQHPGDHAAHKEGRGMTLEPSSEAKVHLKGFSIDVRQRKKEGVEDRVAFSRILEAFNNHFRTEADSKSELFLKLKRFCMRREAQQGHGDAVFDADTCRSTPMKRPQPLPPTETTHTRHKAGDCLQKPKCNTGSKTAAVQPQTGEESECGLMGMASRMSHTLPTGERRREIMDMFCGRHKNKKNKMLWRAQTDGAFEKRSYATRVGSCLTLAGKEWLDDEVTDGHLWTVARRSEENGKKHCCFGTHFCSELHNRGYESVKRWTKSFNLFDKDMVFVPINSGGHWTGIVIEPKKQTIIFFDSNWSVGRKKLETTCSHIRKECHQQKGRNLPEEWKAQTAAGRVPHQRNGHDCGVFLPMFFKCISDGERMEFSEKDMPELRMHIADTLLRKKEDRAEAIELL